MANRLEGSTSPYLLQHKDNPVDWYPWCPEAFEEARRRDVPILLSIGYSSCHWCHVMAHESFEDPETARIMNERFVNIKVDREERPDIDEIYMTALQAMAGHGGWPMTVFLTPDGKPFFAGTYFPKEERGGLPSFKSLLIAISETYSSKRDEVAVQAGKVTELLQPPRLDSDREWGWDLLDGAFDALFASFDDELGGFGGAPKFPQTPNLDYVLRYHSVTSDPRAERLLRTTLDNMALGGIYDQIAGGFFRYSVDRRWEIPHFEKMLYDNAQLLRIYLWAGHWFGSTFYQRIAEETADFLLENFRSPEGGFYSALDADTEGVEGATYTFEYREIEQILAPELFEAAVSYFGITKEGNFEGKNHLTAKKRLEDLSDDELQAVVRARHALAEARKRRPQPGLDDKILASWNGLAIHALADLGRASGKQKYLYAAVEAASFIRESMSGPLGVVHSFRQGKKSAECFASDLASLGIAALALFEATGDWDWVVYASELSASLQGNFIDERDGLLYLAPSKQTDSGDRLIARPKPILDGAEPGPNSLAALLFLRLGRLLDDRDVEERGRRIIRSLGAVAARHPTAFGAALCALLFDILPPWEIVISGSVSEQMRAQVLASYLPNTVLAPGVDNAPPDLPLLEGKGATDSRPAVYVCSGYLCESPAETSAELRAALKRAEDRQKSSRVR